MRLENSFILLPGIGEKTEKKLWKNGISHWDELEEKADGRYQKAANFLDKVRKNLEVENTPFFAEKMPSKALWRLYRNFEDNACFFDIETTGLDREKNRVTTVSFYRGGEDTTLIRGDNLTSENLRKEIFESSVLVSFNGKRFDQPFLERNFDIQVNKPHIDLMYMGKRLGMDGGLKQIEKQLKIDRDLEDVDGREAVRLWKKYENDGDKAALDKLVKYNRYDARNLKQLLEIMHNRLSSNIFEPHIQQ